MVLLPERILYCRRCAHGWIDAPERSEQYETDYFQDLARTPPEFAPWLEARYAEILSTTRDLNPGIRTALDVGCGQGEFVDFLVGRGLQAEGVEPSRKYSAACRERGLVVHTGPSSDLESRGTPYDLVSALHVLEHTVEPRLLVDSLHRLTGPGGILYLEVPNHLEAWRRRAKRLLGKPRATASSLARSGDRQCFSRQSLGTLVRSAGLEVLRIDTRDIIEPTSRTYRRAVVALADVAVRAGLIQGNIIRCWCRPSPQ